MPYASYTRIEELCAERERHWLRCKQILGLPETHDYKDRQLWEEGTKELVDFMNYARALGEYAFASRAHHLAVEWLDKSRKED